eukprot:550274_1
MKEKHMYKGNLFYQEIYNNLMDDNYFIEGKDSIAKMISFLMMLSNDNVDVLENLANHTCNVPNRSLLEEIESYSERNEKQLKQQLNTIQQLMESNKDNILQTLLMNQLKNIKTKIRNTSEKHKIDKTNLKKRISSIKMGKQYQQMIQKGYKLSNLEILSVILYCDHNIFAYRMRESHREQQLNSCEWKQLFYHLYTAVDKIYKAFHFKNYHFYKQYIHYRQSYNNKLFHGIDKRHLHYNMSDGFPLQTITSFSESFGVANEFSSGQGMILSINNAFKSIYNGELLAADVSWISQFGSGEKEWLVLPTKFQSIVKIQNNDQEYKMYLFNRDSVVMYEISKFRYKCDIIVCQILKRLVMMLYWYCGDINVSNCSNIMVQYIKHEMAASGSLINDYYHVRNEHYNAVKNLDSNRNLCVVLRDQLSYCGMKSKKKWIQQILQQFQQFSSAFDMIHCEKKWNEYLNDTNMRIPTDIIDNDNYVSTKVQLDSHYLICDDINEFAKYSLVLHFMMKKIQVSSGTHFPLQIDFWILPHTIGSAVSNECNVNNTVDNSKCIEIATNNENQAIVGEKQENVNTTFLMKLYNAISLKKKQPVKEKNRNSFNNESSNVKSAGYDEKNFELNNDNIFQSLQETAAIPTLNIQLLSITEYLHVAGYIENEDYFKTVNQKKVPFDKLLDLFMDMFCNFPAKFHSSRRYIFIVDRRGNQDSIYLILMKRCNYISNVFDPTGIIQATAKYKFGLLYNMVTNIHYKSFCYINGKVSEYGIHQMHSIWPKCFDKINGEYQLLNLENTTIVGKVTTLFDSNHTLNLYSKMKPSTSEYNGIAILMRKALQKRILNIAPPQAIQRYLSRFNNDRGVTTQHITHYSISKNQKFKFNVYFSYALPATYVYATITISYNQLQKLDSRIKRNMFAGYKYFAAVGYPSINNCKYRKAIKKQRGKRNHKNMTLEDLFSLKPTLPSIKKGMFQNKKPTHDDLVALGQYLHTLLSSASLCIQHFVYSELELDGELKHIMMSLANNKLDALETIALKRYIVNPNRLISSNLDEFHTVYIVSRPLNDTKFSMLNMRHWAIKFEGKKLLMTIQFFDYNEQHGVIMTQILPNTTLNRRVFWYYWRSDNKTKHKYFTERWDCLEVIYVKRITIDCISKLICKWLRINNNAQYNLTWNNCQHFVRDLTSILDINIAKKLNTLMDHKMIASLIPVTSVVAGMSEDVRTLEIHNQLKNVVLEYAQSSKQRQEIAASNWSYVMNELNLHD